MCSSVYVCALVCMCVCSSVYVCALVCMCVCSSVYVYVHMCLLISHVSNNVNLFCLSGFTGHTVLHQCIQPVCAPLCAHWHYSTVNVNVWSSVHL